MKAAIYCRTSTIDQNLEGQLLECRRWCESRNLEFVEYTDQVSGKQVSRPALDRMLQDVRSRKIGVIVIYKLDRLGRSLSHLMQIIAELKNLKVGLVATSQAIDTRDTVSAAGNMMLGLLALFCEFEHTLILERTHSGIAAAKARGVKFGRPEGSRKRPPVKLWLEEKEKGRTLRAFCKEHGISTSTLRRAVAARAA